MIVNNLFENYRKLNICKKIITKDKDLELKIKTIFKNTIEDICYIEDLEKIFVFTENMIPLVRVNGKHKGNWKPIMIFISDKMPEVKFSKDFSSIIIVILGCKNDIKIIKNIALIESIEEDLLFLFNKIKDFLVKVIEPGEVKDYSQSKLEKIISNYKTEEVTFLWGKVPFRGKLMCIYNGRMNGSEGKIYYSQDDKWLFKIYKKNKNYEEINKLKALINDFNSEDDDLVLPINLVEDSSGSIGIQLKNLGKSYKNLSKYCGSIHKYIHNNLTYESYINIAIKISESINKLHVKGYKHGDIHFNNFMVNIKSEKIALIDLDSIAKEHEYLGPKGLWGFRPPENISREGMSIYSDYYSLGILMGYLLLFRNIMEPTKIFDSENQLEDYIISYGKEAKFTELNKEDCKLLKIGQPIFKGGQLSYMSLPLELRTLIERNCIIGLFNIKVRPKVNEWIQALCIAKEKLILCENCKNKFFNTNQKCTFCDSNNLEWEKMKIIEGQYMAKDYKLEYFKANNIPSVIIDAIQIFNKSNLDFIIRGGISLALNGVKYREVSDIDIVVSIEDEIKLLECLEDINFTVAYREITIFNEIRYTVFWKQEKFIKMEIILTDKYIPNNEIKNNLIEMPLKVAKVEYLIFTKLYKVVNIFNEHKVSKKNHIHAKEIIELIPYVKDKHYIIGKLRDKDIDIEEFKLLAIDRIGKYLDELSIEKLRDFLDEDN